MSASEWQDCSQRRDVGGHCIDSPCNSPALTNTIPPRFQTLITHNGIPESVSAGLRRYRVEEKDHAFMCTERKIERKRDRSETERSKGLC